VRLELSAHARQRLQDPNRFEAEPELPIGRTGHMVKLRDRHHKKEIWLVRAGLAFLLGVLEQLDGKEIFKVVTAINERMFQRCQVRRSQFIPIESRLVEFYG
jgi:hypothetical protein